MPARQGQLESENLFFLLNQLLAKNRLTFQSFGTQVVLRETRKKQRS